VKAEKRFLSTIARRLDTLGAITRGQRQTGGQGLFRAEDNLESVHGRAALRQLYTLIYAGKVEGCSLEGFQNATGLSLTGEGGGLREDLPPITTFLNRMLALPIDSQNLLFGAFEDLLHARIEAAIASGAYDHGVETITAESLRIAERHTLYTHPANGAETQLYTIARRDRNEPLTLEEAFQRARDGHGRLLVNAQSGRAAVCLSAPSALLDDGAVERRVRLLRPMDRQVMALADLDESQWQSADRSAFGASWEAECADIPEFTESRMHIVTGLLLPLWKRLPSETCRVYRLQTDDGERVIGRLVSPAWAARALAHDVPTLTPDVAYTALLDGRTVIELEEGLQLRRARVMGAQRIELSGFTDGMVDRFKAMGLMSEIIAWKLRLFVPTGTDGPEILAGLMERYPIARIADRAAA
jgi:hypothetical protein